MTDLAEALRELEAARVRLMNAGERHAEGRMTAWGLYAAIKAHALAQVRVAEAQRAAKLEKQEVVDNGHT